MHRILRPVDFGEVARLRSARRSMGLPALFSFSISSTFLADPFDQLAGYAGDLLQRAHPVIGGDDVERRQDGLQDLPDRLGALPQALVLVDARGCLAGRRQIALVQLLGLPLYAEHGRGRRLQVGGQHGRTWRQRRLLGLQRLLVRGRGGCLAFERVGFGLEPAELVRPRRCRRLQCLRSGWRCCAARAGTWPGPPAVHRRPPLQGAAG